MGEYIEDRDIDDLLGGEDDDGDVCRNQCRSFEDLMEAWDIDAGQEAEEQAHKERLDRDLSKRILIEKFLPTHALHIVGGGLGLLIVRGLGVIACRPI